MRRTSLIPALVVALLLPLLTFGARPALAVDRDVRAVMTASLYGALAGTALGLLSYPFNGKPRSIAIGTSVGLYLGIAMGIYYIGHRDDPGNPLHRRAGASPQPAGSSGERRVDGLELGRTDVSGYSQASARFSGNSSPIFQASLEVTRF